MLTSASNNSSQPVQVGKARNPDATIYVGDLDVQVDEELLWELFLQVGPVAYVHIPKDRVTNQHSGFGFVEFASERDAEYAYKVMGGIKLFSKPIRVNRASTAQRRQTSLDVGANIFVGNLSEEVDERILYETFSRFGVIIAAPKVMRDAETGQNKGFAFISYGDFDASDAAIAALNGQYFGGRPISVSYAIKKDSKTNERHGSEAERLLARQKKSLQQQQQLQMLQQQMHQQMLQRAPMAAAAVGVSPVVMPYPVIPSMMMMAPPPPPPFPGQWQAPPTVAIPPQVQAPPLMK